MAMNMKKKRYSEEQIIGIIKENETSSSCSLGTEKRRGRRFYEKTVTGMLKELVGRVL